MLAPIKKLTLAQQFKLLSLLILLGGMLIVGGWVGRQIEEGVTNRTASITALYVDSFISPLLQPLAQQGELSPTDIQELDRLLNDTPLGQQIVSFKIWLPNGTIIYSTNPTLIGQQFSVGDSLSRALQGEVTATINSLEEEEQASERAMYPQLIEIYAPVRAQRSGEIIASSEFYQLPNELIAEIRWAELRSGVVVGLCTLLMYLILVGIVNHISHILLVQQEALQTKVAQNAGLRDRIRQAGGRATTLNERYLRRISADLHDGPAQDLALALLRSATVTEDLEQYLPEGALREQTVAAWHSVQAALESSLGELRTITAGLRLPEIEDVSGTDVVRRALRDFERKTGCHVAAAVDEIPPDLPLPVKLTLYRILQEALSNGYRHAGGKGQRVMVQVEGDELRVEIVDEGPGFNPETIFREGKLGLATMHERAELLGGCFNIDSAPGRGTRIWSYLPLRIPEVPVPLSHAEVIHV
ncbi:MAG: sensor histidine kinase [Chloroflexi bacterium]|nr:sensor histidine kinase [Chloroflexota bacterium]MBP8060162.1 sensor histidine kinase [Chloroflexota bacterium]